VTPRSTRRRVAALLLAAAIAFLLVQAAVHAAAPAGQPTEASTAATASPRVSPRTAPVTVTAEQQTVLPLGRQRPPALARETAPGAQALLSCWPWDISCQVDSWFSGLAVSVLRPVLSQIGKTGLTTVDYTTSPAVQSMWDVTLGVSDALLGLLIFAGGVMLMGYQTYQFSYTVKEVAPRLVIGVAAANCSLLLTSKAVSVSNAVSTALAGGALPADATSELSQSLMNGTHGSLAVILLVIAAAVLAVVISVTSEIRAMGLVLLIAMAPLALTGYALPHTSWAPRWWWRGLAAVLAIPLAQAVTLTAAMRVFFAPGSSGAPSPDSTGGVLTVLCLLYIVARIPFWIAGPVLQPFGRSPIRRAARFAFSAIVLSRIGRRLRGTDGAPAGGRGTTGTGTGAGTGSRRQQSGTSGQRSGTARGRTAAAVTAGRARPAGSAGSTPSGPGNGTGPGGMPTAPGGPGRPPTAPRHAAPAALPAGNRGYRARHAAAPPLPADGITRPAAARAAGSGGGTRSDPGGGRPPAAARTAGSARPTAPRPAGEIRPGRTTTAGAPGPASQQSGGGQRRPTAPAPSPARYRSQPPGQAPAQSGYQRPAAPLPAAGVSWSGSHREPPPLPAGRGRHMRPAPLPAPAPEPSPRTPDPQPPPTGRTQPGPAGSREPRPRRAAAEPGAARAARPGRQAASPREKPGEER
jgi:hypothetical protein